MPKTKIVIAHPLLTLKNMDHLLISDQKIIIEDRSHQELVNLNGTYKKI